MKGRPRRLIGVIGTHTEVGKTWVLSQLLRRAREEGVLAAARKPAQSFSPDDESTDADRLSAAAGEQPHDVCPQHRWYPVPMAPSMAADQLGRERIELATLYEEIAWPSTVQVGFIETVGGARSPISHDADSMDLLVRADVDEYLLVADAGLGTLNAVRLTLTCVPTGKRCVVVLNRFDSENQLHVLNHRWLIDHGIEAIDSWEKWR